MKWLAGMTDYLYVIVDIAIVSFVIYKLLMLVRGTRAVQLLKGIIVIVLAWFVSTYFNLQTLRWMMEQVFTFGVLVILIIFQPELRRALEQLGRGKLLFNRGNTFAEQRVTKQIGEIVKGISYLSKRRIGALIVLERETGVTDYMETGIIMNAAISSELIINIFIPNTPLHDGAVIIREDKIMAAGSYLPLTENPFISKELGTRHRAGIGISEVSDCISVMVSEETGQVSIAMDGDIIRDLSEESLIAKLYSELRPSQSNWFWRKKGGDDNGQMAAE
ncbi:diadenylate cyclase CdaA [Numidum massiliense]|uniref:diadenylate cyclase CdaA n=1 Tax=Numidum massiliense TaxID=1522315 RepID=UPI0006D59225|nr:diadenylate cyclase CdaA [Numidum massiliense]